MDFLLYCDFRISSLSIESADQFSNCEENRPLSNLITCQNIY